MNAIEWFLINWHWLIILAIITLFLLTGVLLVDEEWF